ncbi:MAG: alpha/beta hydrolase [bacterium]|nr:alpha/beta hydrolase [bacterium]
MPAVQKKRVKSGDVEIYYEVCAGRPGAPVLFLLHGIGGDLDAWQFVRDPLVASGFSTIAMDLRGHGYSGHPTAPSTYKKELLLEDVLAVLEAERVEKVILVGHSGGAVLALEFALQNPDKLSSLVLLAGSYGPPRYLRSPAVQRVVWFFTTVGAALSPHARGPWHSPYPKGKFHKEFELWGLARTLYHNSLRSYLLLGKTLANVDLEQRLKYITLPTLIVVGEKDGIYPVPVSKKMHDEIAHSRLEIIRNANHVLILNNPREVVDLLISFVQKLQK